MYPFARFVPEEERPIAPRPIHTYVPIFSSWNSRMKIVFISMIVILFIISFGVFLYLELQHPVHTLLPTTPAPEEHHFHTFAPHKERHRQTYVHNAFIEMLHQTHSTTNLTNCWVCGLLPSVMHKQDLFISMPLSYLGSCEAWFKLLSMMYTHYTVDEQRFSEKDYELILAYIETHQGFTLSTDDPDGTLDPDACMNVFTDHQNDTWLQDEILDFVMFNFTEYFKYFQERNVSQDRALPVPVLNSSSSFCIQGTGHLAVGFSKCNYTYRLRTFSSPPIITPPNVYFVCGEHAYTWLPRGWSGRCYLSFLYPPVYIAPSDYHKTHQLNKRSLVKRAISEDITDQTDTPAQHFVDIMKGVFPIWGPILTSKEVRRLSRVVEGVINTTAGILTNITVELQATRLVTLQNRMVLDVILADRGGACRVIGSSCCVYIPDSAPTVHLAIQKLHRLASEIHVDTGTWSLTSWFWGLFATWGWKILMVLLGIAGVFITCCICIQCGPACCSYCATRLRPTIHRPKPDKRATQLVQKDIHDLMQIDEGIFED